VVLGKLRPNDLKKFVLQKFLLNDPSVIIGPEVGEDAAVIDLGNERVLVVHPDPISGAVKYLGFLAIHIPCNDIAVTGAYPRYITSVIQLPDKFDMNTLSMITSQIAEASRDLGVTVVGGHTETVAGIDHPLITATALGITKKEHVVRTGNAKSGDVVLMTKTAGIEGTAVLATDFADLLISRGVPKDLIELGASMIKNVSVVKEAYALAIRRLVNSMHDPTEGGIVGGVAEIAYASNVSIELWVDEIPVHPITREFSWALGLDPLKFLSSGSLIATVPRSKVGDALSLLEGMGVKAVIIGEVLKKKDFLISLVKGGEIIEKITDPFVEDEVISLWERTN
jgi:hydrogenase maturation factor